MSEKPIQDPRFLEAMEACRPESDDLKDPALAFLADRLAADSQLKDVFQRLQCLDAKFAEAFRDVPVPDGLADRITARLAADRGPGGALPEEHQTGETGVPGPIAQVLKPRKRLSRRRLLAATAGVAVAASVVVALVVGNGGQPVRQPEEVWQGARDFFERDWEEPSELVATSQPPAAYPAGADFGISNFPQIRWRQIRGFLGECKGVAYDMEPPGSPRATLYVVKCKVPGLSFSAPPFAPSSTTGGRSIGAWQTGGLLYVLVVEGGDRTYRGFLPNPTLT